MDIEEAKKYLKIMIRTFDTKCPNINLRNVNCLKVEAIETVLQALDNSISKDKVKKFIEENSYKNTYNFKTIEIDKLYELLEEK